MNINGTVRARRRRLPSFVVILGATAIAGVVSYLITWLVPHQIGLVRYADFAIVWSAVYLVVGALAGVQQEITRGTQLIQRGERAAGHSARNFGAVLAALVIVIIVGSAGLWVGAVFPHQGWALVWPFAVATTSYTIVAVLCGTLYGLSRWRALGLLIILDALLRLAAVGGVLIFTTSVVALAWAVAVPFPLALLVTWPFLRQRVIGLTQLDVRYSQVTWNVARTVLSSAASSLMVSGFPLLLSITSSGEPRAVVGLYILTVTLSRAPLIVVAISLQSYFIVLFRDRTQFWGTFLRLQLLVGAAGVVLAGAGWLIGPAVFRLLFPNSLQPDGWFIAVLVLSSALVGSLCVSAPAVLARSQHFVYSCGWIAAAAITVIALDAPLDFTLRTVLALVCGPFAGLVVHLGYLIASRKPGEGYPDDRAAGSY